MNQDLTGQTHELVNLKETGTDPYE